MEKHLGVKIREVNTGVFFAEDPILRIGQEEANFLKKRVMHTQRKTIRLCMHRSVDAAVHEMLILHSKEAYIRPHKHPGKSVSYHIIEGTMDMVLFDDKGSIVDVIAMGEYGTQRKFYYRLDTEYYYAPLVRSDFLLFHETIKGPFEKFETIFAPWATAEDDAGAVIEFKQELINDVDHFTRR